LDKKIKEGIHLTKTNGNCFEWEIMGSIIKKLMKEVEM